MGTLTTHVLDTAQGRPGVGMQVDLYRWTNGQRQLVKSVTTNGDGRCDEPLLEGRTFESGEWELQFHVGRYFTEQALDQSDPPFLSQIPVRFTIARDGHYHVPLLVSPWSYTTYRGS
ncbi:MAG: hydroxyisourate hydrolase [Caldilineaceae bacterium]|nr:hydroxyisourate hydrolase [Caldilineaceae bacterium]